MKYMHQLLKLIMFTDYLKLEQYKLTRILRIL
ncbi:hypothetical protein Q7M_1280 (plasmid) [Borrelia crocidurae str. Achema]|uniref:Uncharacterized protein n=1 Tax=Borrelia crocidurae (strain Achema) TaxID=1155096 RepID=I0FEY1_BORCA|nr:hypothetical protein Q7M_1280 [Borrelia crocidurae str. Achema]